MTLGPLTFPRGGNGMYTKFVWLMGARELHKMHYPFSEPHEDPSLLVIEYRGLNCFVLFFSQ